MKKIKINVVRRSENVEKNSHFKNLIFAKISSARTAAKVHIGSI